MNEESNVISEKKIDLISIIVPVYNLQDYVKYCIKSIQAQTYKNLEIIIVDDGSTDNSYHLLSKIEKLDDRINLIRQENQGVSAARNVGKSIAKGKYLMFIDGDDAIRKDCVEALHNDITAYNADMSACEYEKIYELSIMESGTWNSKNLEDDVQVYNTNLLYEFFDDKFANSSCTKLYRKSAIEKVDFSVGRKNNEDRFFLFQIMNYLKVATVRKDNLYIHYIREGSASKFTQTLPLDQLYFADEILHQVSKSNSQIILMAKTSRAISVIDFYHRLMRLRLDEHLKKEMFIEYKSYIKNINLETWRRLNPKYKLDLLMLKTNYFFYKNFYNVGYAAKQRMMKRDIK